MLSNKATHQWSFERIGGFDQVKLASDSDWQHIADLDTKLWAVLSCPSHQLSLTEKTLKRLDKDNDGRIRVNELTQAIEWVCEAVIHPSLLLARQAKLPITAFRSDTELGQKLLALAELLLGEAEDKTHITLDPVETAMIRFSQQAFNGDGVITTDAIENELLLSAFEELVSCVGSREDLSGKQGVDADLVDVFTSAIEDRLTWISSANDSDVMLFGDETLQAITAFEEVEAKINDYFARCSLVSFDAQSAPALNPNMGVYEAMYAASLTKDIGDIQSLPLAQVNADECLSLLKGINPAWQVRMQAFNIRVVQPVLGDVDSLTLSDWNELSRRLQSARQWLDQEQGVLVAALSHERLMLWKKSDWASSLNALIEQDEALSHQLTELDDLLTLLLFMRDLNAVVQNTISMRDFYSPDHKGSFEAGQLFIDGRSMRLSVIVDDISKHATMAYRSGIFLLYCDCAKRNGTDKMSIVSAVTAGNADHLMVGRHGVFYDNQGDEWDAVIVRMVEHPISVGEAFWSPYKRLGRMIGSQLEKFASAKEKEVAAKSAAALEKTSEKATQIDSKVSMAAPFDIAKFAGIFAAMGLAIGALGTALATIVTAILLLPLWQIPVVFVAIMLLISGPSMLLAWVKLRKRNLGPILDANGWAVNTHASISISFGATLTQVARLPAGAKRSLVDPFAPKSNRVFGFLFLLFLLITTSLWYWQDNKPVQVATDKVVPTETHANKAMSAPSP